MQICASVRGKVIPASAAESPNQRCFCSGIIMTIIIIALMMIRIKKIPLGFASVTQSGLPGNDFSLEEITTV